MARCVSTSLALFLLFPGCSIEPFRTNPDAPERSAAEFDHDRFDRLLKEHVGEDGLVDYSGLRADRAELQAYLDSLAGFNPHDSIASTGNDRKAYWINAYNAITLAGILRFYPVDSVRDLAGFWDNVLTNCGGRIVSLNDIEHRILRPMGDPRIHAAITCASMGCPVLRRGAYSGARLDAELDEACREFLADTRRNRFDDREQRAWLSRIFDWFGADFGVEPYGGVRGFVRRYALPREWLAGDFPISFLDYDWSLNDSRRQ